MQSVSSERTELRDDDISKTSVIHRDTAQNNLNLSLLSESKGSNVDEEIKSHGNEKPLDGIRILLAEDSPDDRIRVELYREAMRFEPLALAASSTFS